MTAGELRMLAALIGERIGEFQNGAERPLRQRRR
jgi:hypothetical protein